MSSLDRLAAGIIAAARELRPLLAKDEDPTREQMLGVLDAFIRAAISPAQEDT